MGMKVRRGVCYTLAIAATWGLTACGGSSSKGTHTTGATATTTTTTSSSAATATSTTPSRDDQARKDALTAYTNFVNAQTRMLATNAVTKEDLSYSDGDAFSNVRALVLADQKANVVLTGQPASAPTITALNITASASTATVLDCFGGPTWTPVYASGKDKGKSAEASNVPLVKHPVTSSVADENGQWKVIDFKLDWSNSC